MDANSIADAVPQIAALAAKIADGARWLVDRSAAAQET